MYLSYWEYKTWFNQIDFVVVGSGIVGLNCALTLREKYPKSKIVVIEKGFLPAGASTKNAGFACFGSLSEIIADLKTHSQEEVFQLVKRRYEGLQLLRKNLGDKNIGYKNYGGYEIFLKDNAPLYEDSIENINRVNELLAPLFGRQVFTEKKQVFNFSKIFPKLVFNPLESQIDTGKMMQALIKKVRQKNVLLINGAYLSHFQEGINTVHLQINKKISFQTQKLYIATNGFAGAMIPEDVQPARAQVLITKAIPQLKIKGTFHIDQGYYYFRNIDNRILLGGGRNLDFQTETTAEYKLTEIIQNRLEKLLHEVILPDLSFEIDTRWCGIMGVGVTKKPIVKALSNRIFCGIRLSGMGVAIGTQIGNELGNLD